MKTSNDQNTRLISEIRIGLFIIVIFSIVFLFHLISHKIDLFFSSLSFLAFLIFFGTYILQGNPVLLSYFNNRIKQSNIYLWFLPIGLWLLSVLYGLMTNQFTWQLLMGGLVYCAIGLTIILFLKDKSGKLYFLDVVLILFLWFPIEFSWTPNLDLPPVHSLANAYKLIGLTLIIYFYVVVRNLPDVGFTYQLTKNDLWIGIKKFLLFMPFALLIGFPTNFVELSTQLPEFDVMIPSLLGIAFFIALPEEILFRGVIHNLIEKRLSNKKHGLFIALTISSIIFGLAHGNNHNPPFIDINLGKLGIWQAPWVYILLATIAGFFYGWAYIKTRKVSVAAITHLLVDWFWSNFFSG
jgi:membrane protease YdiL (CAAX protease family)